jgi:hypothetical protein
MLIRRLALPLTVVAVLVSACVSSTADCPASTRTGR